MSFLNFGGDLGVGYTHAMVEDAEQRAWRLRVCWGKLRVKQGGPVLKKEKISNQNLKTNSQIENLQNKHRISVIPR